MLIVLMPVSDDEGGGRLARQTALSENSCCESVTGQEEAEQHCKRPQAGGGDGHDAGGHRAATCKGLGQGARSTLGKGLLIVIFCLMMT